jgi:hypothetical protein
MVARRDTIEKLSGAQDMTLIALIALRADGEGLAAAKLDALIEPHLGNNICEKGEIVVGHTKLGLAGVQSAHEREERNGVRPRHERAVPKP